MNYHLYQKISFILVEPIYSGNIGACARVIKNFGFKNMVLINPVEVTKETISLSSHAYDIVENAKRYGSILEAIKHENYDIIIGTTGILSSNIKNYSRQPIFNPESIISILNKKMGYNSKIAILFGRENFGLKNEELKLCTLVCSIPTNPIYPILNLSHSVGIIAYELSKIKSKCQWKSLSNSKIERLLNNFEILLNNIDYDNNKLENILVLLNRIIGRIDLTQHEYDILISLIKEFQYHITKNNECKKLKIKNKIEDIFEKENIKENIINLNLLN